jgi:predicted P-loop ATPase
MSFESVNSDLLCRAESLLSQWLPGGKSQGGEYVCGSIHGGKGKSFNVSLKTGQWIDHAESDLKGSDLISLYATINNISQGDALKELEDKPIIPKTRFSIKSGQMWEYRLSNGEPAFYVVRREINGKKTYSPYSWTGQSWEAKAYPDPRPLYNLDKLKSNPGKSVVVVEGEKSAEACAKLFGDSCVITTWAHGAKSIYKTDWKPLAGHKILLWPDADDVGRKAMNDIASSIGKLCPDIQIIDTKEKPEGWDSADAVSEGMTAESFKKWASEKIYKYDHKADEDLDVKPTVSLNVAWEKLGLFRNANGIPVPNLDNGLRVLENDEKYVKKIWWDEFHQKIFSNLYHENPKEWSDLDTIKLVADLQRRLGISRFSKESAYEAAFMYAHGDVRDEPKDWMDSLKWDGKSRVESFFKDYFNTENSDYYTSISKNFWVSMVARIFSPGCKVDNMVILQGEQGVFKTMAMEIIGGPWYVSLTKSVENDDFLELFQGKMLAEMAELEAFNRSENTRIKAILTTRSDRYRKKYGRFAEEHPRRCIFVGTTNEEHCLKDLTGARRFWPVKVGFININKLTIDREQLFAEAVYMLKSGETWYHVPESAKEIQENSRMHDDWEEDISNFINNRYTDDGFRTSDVATDVLKIDSGKLTQAIQNRIASILRKQGMKPEKIRVGESTQRRWIKK